MIQYLYKKSKLLFVGINPHFGSFDRGVPFSNNKLFWYLLSEAGIIEEKRDELRDDETLKRMYQEKFNAVYGLRTGEHHQPSDAGRNEACKGGRVARPQESLADHKVRDAERGVLCR